MSSQLGLGKDTHDSFPVTASLSQSLRNHHEYTMSPFMTSQLEKQNTHGNQLIHQPQYLTSPQAPSSMLQSSIQKLHRNLNTSDSTVTATERRPMDSLRTPADSSGTGQ